MTGRSRSQTDTCIQFPDGYGSRSQPAHRSLSRSPASRAIRSSSEWVGVADADRMHPHAAVPDHDLGALGALRERVVRGGLERHLVEVHPLDRDPLAVLVEAGRVGDERLHREDAVRGEVTGHRPEARELLLPTEQHEEGAEDGVDQPERAREREVREAADRGREPRSAGLRPGIMSIASDAFDPVDLHTGVGQRDRDPARPDPELQRRAVPGQLSQERHRPRGVLGEELPRTGRRTRPRSGHRRSEPCSPRSRRGAKQPVRLASNPRVGDPPRASLGWRGRSDRRKEASS